MALPLISWIPSKDRGMDQRYKKEQKTNKNTCI